MIDGRLPYLKCSQTGFLKSLLTEKVNFWNAVTYMAVS
jgi:hypothetical protein